jgi:predicted HicB family RNase H-like nuclease
MIEFKGYIGKVEFDDEADIFHGEVINTRDVITFQGQSVAELKKAFKESVEDYLEFCASRGEEPDKPFSGQFVTRISPEVHRQASIAASLSGKSLNAWVSEEIQSALARIGWGETKKAAKWKHSRLCFKADLIEPLSMDEQFCVETKNEGTFVMSKRQFYETFPNVVKSVSYERSREYHYTKAPKKALRFRI